MEVLLGLVAYLLYFIYDLNTIKKNNKFLRTFFLLGSLLLLGSTTLFVIKTFENHSIFLIILMSLLSLFFLSLLVYTLFFAIPFDKTYLKESEERLAYTKGVYSICRHPGMLWYTGLYLSLWGLTGNLNAFYFYVIMIFLDLLYIIYQDVLIFPKTFSNYNEYKNTTPFLIPSFRKKK